MEISSILGPLSFGLLLTLVYISAKEKPKKDKNGNPILRTSMVYTIIGAIASLASLGILIIGLFIYPNDETIAVIIFFLMLAGLGVPLFLVGINARLIFNKEQMEYTNMIRKIKVIKWNSIKSISFGKISLSLKIKSNDKTINVHQYTIGFNDFVNAIEANTSYTKQTMGVPIYNKK